MSLLPVAEQRSGGGSSIRTGFRVRPCASIQQESTVVNPIELDTEGQWSVRRPNLLFIRPYETTRGIQRIGRQAVSDFRPRGPQQIMIVFYGAAGVTRPIVWRESMDMAFTSVSACFFDARRHSIHNVVARRPTAYLSRYNERLATMTTYGVA